MTTPEQLRQEASESFAKAEESFDRCDTDGFVSQWAHGLSGEKSRMEADLLEAGGVTAFPGLFDGGRRVAAKLVPGKFGSVWLLMDEEAARYGRRFIPFNHNSRVQRELGLHEGDELAPAIVKFMGNDATSVRPVYIRIDGGYSGANEAEAMNG